MATAAVELGAVAAEAAAPELEVGAEDLAERAAPEVTTSSKNVLSALENTGDRLLGRAASKAAPAAAQAAATKGAETAAKGAETAAKGAETAAKGAETAAKGAETALETLGVGATALEIGSSALDIKKDEQGNADPTVSVEDSDDETTVKAQNATITVRRPHPAQQAPEARGGRRGGPRLNKGGKVTFGGAILLGPSRVSNTGATIMGVVAALVVVVILVIAYYLWQSKTPKNGVTSFATGTVLGAVAGGFATAAYLAWDD
jgi:hypothetical protein